VTAPDDEAVEAIRARWRAVLDEPRSGDGSADVAALFAALDASRASSESLTVRLRATEDRRDEARADAQRERERADAAERDRDEQVTALVDGGRLAIAVARRAAIEEAIARVEAAHPTDVGPDGVIAILRALIDGPPRDVRRAAIEEAIGAVQAVVRGRVRSEDHDAYVHALRALLDAPQPARTLTWPETQRVYTAAIDACAEALAHAQPEAAADLRAMRSGLITEYALAWTGEES
jgi:hypothetical protein